MSNESMGTTKSRLDRLVRELSLLTPEERKEVLRRVREERYRKTEPPKRATATPATVTTATPLEDLNLSVRVLNCMDKHEVITVGDAVGIPSEGLMWILNLGRLSRQELRQELARFGFLLAADLPSRHLTKYRARYDQWYREFIHPRKKKRLARFE